MTDNNPPPGNLDILIVDDEHSIRDILSRALQGGGYAVRSAASGEAALVLLRENACRLLITDYLMPGINGCELIRAARQLHPGIKSMMISVYFDQSAQIRSEIQHTADLLISKPFSVHAVVEAVKKMLGEVGADAGR